MNRVKQKRMMIFAGIIILVLSSGISFVMTKQQMIAQQKAVIGKLYQKDMDACEILVRSMFETSASQKEQENGEKALIELGYTSQGMEYLYAESSMLQLHSITLLLLVCVAGIIFYTMYRLELQQQKKEEQMAADINACMISGEELQASRYDICSPTLVHTISQLLKTLHAKEQELKEKNQRAQSFVENIAHQIKTPLACVSISLDLLLEKLQDRNQIEHVQQSFLYLKEIETLMKKLLDIGRLESGKLLMQKTAIRLDNLLEECALLLAPEEEKFAIKVECESEVIQEYYGDYEWLKEAFSNILKNCMEHDKSGEQIVVKLIQKKEDIFVQIRDHGPGISEEDLSHIFDRFYIPDKAKKSHTGIGLNLAELVFKKHFGVIEAFNHEDGGAVFSIVLPTYGLKNEKISFT